MTVVATNSYARWDLVRKVVPDGCRTGCRWCGRHARFQYGISRHDKPAAVWEQGVYCGIDCYRSYTME